MKYSIIIPTYNREDDLLQCLNSIKLNSSYQNEIIILTPNIYDELNSISEKYGARLVLDKSRTNGMRIKSLWGILNYGINLAKNDWVVWLNDDCLVTEKWDEKAFKNVNNNTSLIILKTFGIGNEKSFRIGQTKFDLPCANYAFLNKNMNIRFDDRFNWFHGDADISLQAFSKSLEVIQTNDNILIHNHKIDLNRTQNETDKRVIKDDILFKKKWKYWVYKKKILRPSNILESIYISLLSVLKEIVALLYRLKKITIKDK